MIASILFDCPKAGAQVRLEIDNEIGGLFKSIKSQTVLKCDLHDMGGCRMKLAPMEDPPCVALAKARKCALK